MEETKREDTDIQNQEMETSTEPEVIETQTSEDTMSPTEDTSTDEVITDTGHMLEKPSFFFQHRTKIVFAGLVLIIILLAGYIILGKDKNSTLTNDPILSLFNLEDNGAVAKVNGTKISFERFAETIKELSGNAQQQGANISDLVTQGQIKEQALTLLIDTTILLQAAQEAGFTASEEELGQEYALIEEGVGGSEALMTELEAIGLTEDKLRKNLEERIVITKYLESDAGIGIIEATDKEVREFYDSAIVNLPEEQIPAFEDVQSELESQVILQKQQEQTATFINILKENSKIDILI